MYGNNSNVILSKVEKISSNWLEINGIYQRFKMPVLIVQAPMSTLPEQKTGLKFSEKRKKLAEQNVSRQMKLDIWLSDLRDGFAHKVNGLF